jgi:beta-glucosidase
MSQCKNEMVAKLRTKCLLVTIILFLIVQSDVHVAEQSIGPTSSATKSVEQRVESILQQMTLDEKIDLIGGVDDMFVRGVPRLDLPKLKMADGPCGVRHFGPATAMPCGMALAATWNPDLAKRIGAEIARDARGKGVHFLLGPGVNIYRSPVNGRNFEYFGEDPFLASRIAVSYINGVQSQGVSATIKHFMGNNSEFDRQYTDSVIDERTMREIYLPMFEAAVKEARVGAIMDAFNHTSGVYMTENSYLNTDVLKREWGFDGLVMSDWGATHDAVAAANGGLDLDMGSPRYFVRAHLLPAIEQGKVSVATIDDKVRRILRVAVRFGWLNHDQTDLSIPRYNLSAREVALDAARESMVLLKNEDNLLPLDKEKIKSIAVIGPNAYPAVPVGGGSAAVQPFTAVSYLEGLSNYLGNKVSVYYQRGIPSLSDIAEATNFYTAELNGEPGLRADYFNNPELQGLPMVSRTERRINFGFGSRQTRGFPEGVRSARWSGYYVANESALYEISVGSAGENGGFYRLYIDDKEIIDNWALVKAQVSNTSIELNRGAHKIVLERHGRNGRMDARMQLGIALQSSLVNEEAKKLAALADVVVLAVGFDALTEGEGADRTFGLPIGQDELIRQITSANKNTIVVLTSGGGVDMRPWLSEVPALVESWYAGQEGGRALAEILFGDVNPSGRLPVTFEKRLEDNPTFDSYYPEPNSNRVTYKEGVFVGYRGFEHNGTKPLFPFGYGLSYTSFKYSDLSIKPVSANRSSTDSSESRYEVSFSITNTGSCEGAEVAQVYLGESHARIPRPAKELKGFAKMMLKPGETKRVSIDLDARSLSYYDVGNKTWRVDAGNFEILVGRSAEQIEYRGMLAVHPPLVSK